jgi:glycosyltransferase involved in cell wall biosynthesis
MPPSFSVEVVAEPTLRAAYEAASRADLVYVIDAGRHGVLGIASTRLRRRRLVVECGDSSPALYRSMGRSRPAIVAGAVVDRFVGRHSDAVVVRWRECAEVMDVRVPWIEVADGVDVTRFSPELENGARARHGIPPDALVVGLVGSLTWSSGAKLTYGWDVVEALARLRDKPVWGLVVGGGDGLKRLGSRALELGVADRLVLTGEVEHRDVPQYICALDVCVSTQTNDAVGRSRTTSKLPEYLACDRFVLATAVGAARVVLPPEMLLPYEGTVDQDHPGLHGGWRSSSHAETSFVPAAGRARSRSSGTTTTCSPNGSPRSCSRSAADAHRHAARRPPTREQGRSRAPGCTTG